MLAFLRRLFWTAAVYSALIGTVLFAYAQHKLDLYQLQAQHFGWGGDLDYLLVDQANTMQIAGVAALVLAGWWATLAISTALFIRKELRQMQRKEERHAKAMRAEADQWPFNVKPLR